MKERPILFSSEMVCAILDGRKTQTRRVVKPLCGCPDFYDYKKGHPYPYYFRRRDAVWASFKTIEELAANYCPFGTVGDRLYVRESFTYWEDDEFGGDYLEYRTGHRRSLGEWEYPHPIYDHCVGRFGKWTPSIHAPRWASRITLEITGVRIERLNDISEEDAIAEGIEPAIQFPARWKDYQAKFIKCGVHSPTLSFVSLWQSINAKKHSWESNPWVWVVEFKRVEE
jgi:hypothetical protein